MRYYLALALFAVGISSPQLLLAQNELGKTDIGVGIGGSIIGLIFVESEFGPGAEPRTSRVWNLTVDHAFHKNVSAGIAVSHQGLFVEYDDYQWYDEVDSTFVVSSFTEQLSRSNISIRMLFHGNLGAHNPNFDPYLGLRMGYSHWHYIHDSPDPPWDEDGLDLTRNWVSAQILVGAKYYATKNLGFHMELGLGSPYAVAMGVNFKFGKQLSQ